MSAKFPFQVGRGFILLLITNRMHMQLSFLSHWVWCGRLQRAACTLKRQQPVGEVTMDRYVQGCHTIFGLLKSLLTISLPYPLAILLK